MNSPVNRATRFSAAGYQAKHFVWRMEKEVGVLTLNRPDRKNPLTFDSYEEMRELFRALPYAHDVKAVVLAGAAAAISVQGGQRTVQAGRTLVSRASAARSRNSESN